MRKPAQETVPAKQRKGHPGAAPEKSGASARVVPTQERTQRGSVEEALAESEQKFRAVFDQASIGIALGNLDGLCVRANKAACDFIGATEEEVCRLRIQDIVHPADFEMTANVFPRLVAGEIPSYTIERRYVRRDGTIVWGRASVSLVRDATAKPKYLVGVMADITQERRLEIQRAAFSQLGYHLSAAVSREQAANIIFEIASELFGWDAGYLDLYSEAKGEISPVLTVDTIDGRRMPVPPGVQSYEPSPMMLQVMKEGGRLINRGKEPAAEPGLVPFGDAKRRSVSLMFVPVHSGGAVVGILSIQSYGPSTYSRDDLKLLQTLADLCGDALERIKVAEALLEAEAKYRGIFEKATEGIFQASPEGRYLSVNPAMARLFGYQSPEEMIASIQDIGRQTFVRPEERHKLMRLHDKQGSVRRFEAQRYRKDGSVFWSGSNAHAVRDGAGKVLYYEGTNHDITEIVQAREALARSHEELERLVRERTAQLEAANESLRNQMADRERLERQVLESVEREQERIGQDLHDGLCQLLAGIKFKVASLGAKLQQKGLSNIEEIRDIEPLVNQAICQGYGLARGLNPVEFPGHGLTLALKELAGSVEAAFGVNCVCDFRTPVAIDDQAAANHLYRIAQEAIHNAIKHGKPREITITLSEQAGEVVLAIKDDGAGFPAHAGPNPGMGLQNMKVRAGMIGAALEIHAGESGGTVVTCRLASPTPQSRTA